MRLRWWRVAAVLTATLLLLASSCSLQTGDPIPEGVPPPRGAAVPEIDTNATGRPADQLSEWAADLAPAIGIPVKALEAYAYAARVAQVVNPKCNLAWTTLAGIGMVESHHGTYQGAAIAAGGDVRPPIRGVQLDGTLGNMEILDTDNGELDGDARLDRAMGPDAVHPGDLAAVRGGRQQRQRDQPGQLRRRRALGGGLSVLAGQGPVHPARAGWRHCAPTTCPTSTRAACGTGPPPTPTVIRSQRTLSAPAASNL